MLLTFAACWCGDALLDHFALCGQAAKKETRREGGQECEHGIWRCKICFPHPGTGAAKHAHAHVEVH